MLNQTLKQAGARERQPRTLAVSLARSAVEVLEAQRLRYRIFAEELGCRVPGAAMRIDCDAYDPHCEHLLVRDTGNGEVVGTYRLLPGQRAREIGGFYADGEFDLTRLKLLRDATVEIGRSCVHPDYRNGATITRLWAGIVAYMEQHHYQYLMGCASLGMADGGHSAAGVYRRLIRNHQSPAEYRVFPRCALPLAALARNVDVLPPPLVKGYIRAGAYVCGEPALDPDFNTADLLMLLPMARMDTRYARHFMNN